MSYQIKRSPYQGAQQILQYNWTFYAVACVLCAGGILLWLTFDLGNLWRVLLGLAIFATVFWSSSSLIISHYVYDRSELYRLTWLQALLKREPDKWINIHAGLDETSLFLIQRYPDSDYQILDIYDPATMTEPAIKRARKITIPELTGSPVDFRQLPVPDEACDVVFIFFAAHELRTEAARVSFLREVYRLLKIGSQVIIVEHLRDFPNFLAFGPGFFHFLTHNDWLTAIRLAKFASVEEIKITPFVSAFCLQK